MVDTEHPFRLLMERVRGGSDNAAQELVGRYEHHVLRVVRRRLNTLLRSKFDSADFVQAVWCSFFTNRARVAAFDQPEALIAYLATMAANKVMKESRRRMQSVKYNVNREHSIESSCVGHGAILVARQPTPSQFAIAHEQWDRLLQGQPEHYQHMLDLRRKGVTCEEIARQLGVNEKTVRRVMQKLNPQ